MMFFKMIWSYGTSHVSKSCSKQERSCFDDATVFNNVMRMLACCLVIDTYFYTVFTKKIKKLFRFDPLSKIDVHLDFLDIRSRGQTLFNQAKTRMLSKIEFFSCFCLFCYFSFLYLSIFFEFFIFLTLLLLDFLFFYSFFDF